MLRPPPLQLKLDNTLPPRSTPAPRTGASFVAQLYKANWRNFVIAVAGLNALRFAYACYTAVSDAIVDDDEAADSLAEVSIALAVMYLAALLTEVFGVVAVCSHRLALVRAYFYLAILSTATVCAAAVLRGVVYFVYAEELVYECITLAGEGRVSDRSTFRTRPWPAGMPPMYFGTARKHCVAAWVHASYPTVAAVFVFGVLPALAALVLVGTYTRQASSATHAASLLRVPSTAHASHARRGGRGGGGRGGEYAAVAVSSSHEPVPRRGRRQVRSTLTGTSSSLMTTTTTATATSTTTPAAAAVQSKNMRGGLLVPGTKRLSPSPPRGRGEGSGSMQRARRPPPLVRSPEPLGLGPSVGGLEVRQVELGRSPGPPSYSKVSRVYRAFAAPVGGGRW